LRLLAQRQWRSSVPRSFAFSRTLRPPRKWFGGSLFAPSPPAQAYTFIAPGAQEASAEPDRPISDHLADGCMADNRRLPGSVTGQSSGLPTPGPAPLGTAQ